MHASANQIPDFDALGPGGPKDEALPPKRPPVSSQAFERRRHLRRDVLAQRLVSIQLGANNGGLIVDLSAGGAAVVSVAPLERSTTSSFTLQWDDGPDQIEGTGEFVWVDSTGLNGGLRFDRLSKRAQHVLAEWLSGARDIPYEEDAVPAPVATVIGPDTPGMGTPAPAAVPIDITSPKSPDRLQRAVERAQIAAEVNGACIALRGPHGFRCEASIGIAPEIGLTVNQDRGLAAECIAGKYIVVCNDASRDPRVSAAARQQLSFQSAVFLPLCVGDELVGILGAFSERRDAFGEQAIARMEAVARVIESRINPSEDPKSARPSRAAGANVAPATRPADKEEPPILIEIPVYVIVVLVVSFVAAAIVYFVLFVHRAQQPARSAKAQVAAVAAANNPPSPATPVTGERHPASAPVAIHTAASVPRHAQAAMPADTARVTQPPATEGPKPPETSTRPTNARVNPEPGTPVDLQQTPTPPKPSVTASAPPAVVSPPPPTEQNAASKPVVPAAAVPAASTAAPQLPPPAPHVDVITEVLPAHPGANVTPVAPQLVSKTDIHYPTEALASRRQGSVVLKVTVDRNGTVQNLQVLDGDQLLASEAVRAVRQWHYRLNESGRRNDAVVLLLTVNFVLGQ